MNVAETVAVVRDIFIIVACGVSIVVLLGVGYSILRLYPIVKRATQNVERSSSIIHSMVSQPLNLFGAVVELLNRGLGILETFRKRNRRNENGEV